MMHVWLVYLVSAPPAERVWVRGLSHPLLSLDTKCNDGSNNAAS
jgi:hypothetical protein